MPASTGGGFPLLRPVLAVALVALLSFSPITGLAVEPGAFTTPQRILPEGNFGYEPGLKAGPDGTLYTFIHKGDPAVESPARLASWISYSKDGGATWHEMPSPGQAHSLMFAFESDVAIDADNVVYNIDTYLLDNSITRWQATEDEPVWLDSRPAMVTTHLDDRPWVATTRAGVLHYLGSAYPMPAESITGEGIITTQMWYSASHDGGLTWTPARGVPSVGFCHIASGTGASALLLIACYDADRKGFAAFESTDEGATWTRVSVQRGMLGAGPLFPSAAVAPDGEAYTTWIDDIPGAHTEPALPILAAPQPEPNPAKLMAGTRSADGAWTTRDVSPFAGTFAEPWISAGPDGQVAVVVYGAHDVNLHAQTLWHVYAITWCADAPDVRTSTRIDDVPVVRGILPPGHFFQGAFGADGTLHVAYDRMEWNFIVPGFMNNPDIPSIPHHVRSTEPVACG